MLKTYSRGRAAVAAAKKALGHLDAFIINWSPVEADDGEKFTAMAIVRPGGGKEIIDTVKAAGFKAMFYIVEPAADPAPEITEAEDDDSDDKGIMDAEGHGDAEPDLEDTVSELLEDMGEDIGEPLTAVAPKGRGGYINEVSSAMGACELARSIAHQMPDAPRKEVIAACRQAGIAYGTARTQIQKVRGGK